MQQAEAIDLILQLTRGYLAPRCLHVVAELGIADHIGERARSLIELAEATATNPDALARTLGLPATQGVFAATGEPRYGPVLVRAANGDPAATALLP